ncbi:DDE-domain-containing protein [Conidiobolus coronatus NRRL 28638]|uniref:DDE-domain-containing protein n=1 Tax=Conidiobolus coronatus (strain ATCC 28846 / CBS 209.66 / NRRL 28638) TaxID=796925 RepID=A0A137NZS8_CONC2|nr:DDE-domain-containing protein [Conidiobolus coronatus NRRL 28638]|eukprot:KXN68171.1 DDE-domain-containing protein [Conidiobolus coronatus NRRL 28638]
MQWIKYFDSLLDGRNVLLLLDNVSSHKLKDSEISTLSLNNTRIHYLPKNSTSRLQPLDAGIISAFKQNYISRYYQDLNEISDDEIEDYKINLLQGIKLSAFIWDTVITPDSIKNCWNHTKIESKEVFGPNVKTTNLYMSLDIKYKARIQQGLISKKLTIPFILS